MCDDCSESTSTSDTSCDISSDTSCDTSTDMSTDITSELPEDTGDLSDDGVEELPDNSGEDLEYSNVQTDDCSEESVDIEPESIDSTADGEDIIDEKNEDEQNTVNKSMDVVDDTPFDDTETTDLNESKIKKIVSNDLCIDGSEELPDGTSDSKTYDKVADYYNQHNYGKDDYHTYSQDPVWRQLMREKYPNVKLPPYESIAEYYGAHNYGQDDYDVYSKDPEWRQLMREQYPSVELPPYNNFGEYYSAHNYGPQDYNTYSQDPDWKYLVSDYKFSQALDDFTPNKWNDMGLEERQIAINKLSNYCCGDLGIEKNPKITYYEGEKGDYGWSRPGEIGININEMGDPIETADTVAHEYRHQYQRERAENPQTPEEIEWRENLKPGNYIHSEVDRWGYQNQPVERDARQYAQRYRDKVLGGKK